MTVFFEILGSIIGIAIFIVLIVLFFKERIALWLLIIVDIVVLAGVVALVTVTVRTFNAVTSVKMDYDTFVNEKMPDYLEKNAAYVFRETKDKGVTYTGTITCDQYNLIIDYGKADESVQLLLPRQKGVPYSYSVIHSECGEYTIDNSFDNKTIIEAVPEDKQEAVSELTYRTVYQFLKEIKNSHLRVNSNYLGIFPEIAKKFGVVRKVDFVNPNLTYENAISILLEKGNNFAFREDEPLISSYDKYYQTVGKDKIVLKYENIQQTFDNNGDVKGEYTDTYTYLEIPVSGRPQAIIGHYYYHDDSFNGLYEIPMRAIDDAEVTFISCTNTNLAKSHKRLAMAYANTLMKIVNSWFVTNYNMDLELIGLL